MNSAIVIRPYTPQDRAAVRRICCDTADSGQPLEGFFADREVIADLVTRYYTDIAPQCTWVAADGDGVVGYLTGCLDTARAGRTILWRVVPAVFVKAVGRGTFWQRPTRVLLRLNWRDWFRSLFARSGVSVAEYPAHLHINLTAAARGHGVGRQLVERFYEQMRAAGVRGVHAAVSGANAGGQQFFQALGFIELGRRGRFRQPRTPDRLTPTILYGKQIP
jgi:ribosomal protein S18 acetylase RimI-like enzyme